MPTRYLDTLSSKAQCGIGDDNQAKALTCRDIAPIGGTCGGLQVEHQYCQRWLRDEAGKPMWDTAPSNTAIYAMGA